MGCVDIANMDEEVLDEIDRRVGKFIPAARALLSKKTNIALALTFVGGAHIGCKPLYVLADSSYNTTADLKGQKASAPNGVGKSDHNIVALLLDADGINYATDVGVVQVTADACVTAMENSEIAAALLSDICLFHGQGGQAHAGRTTKRDCQKVHLLTVAEILTKRS